MHTKIQTQTSTHLVVEPFPFLQSIDHKDTNININLFSTLPSLLLFIPIYYYIYGLNSYITMYPIPLFPKYKVLWSKIIQILQYYMLLQKVRGFLVKPLCYIVSLCWHYDACVVLDGNSLVEEQLYGN